MVKQAKLTALRMLAGHTIGDISPIGNLKLLAKKEKKQVKLPVRK